MDAAKFIFELFIFVYVLHIIFSKWLGVPLLQVPLRAKEMFFCAGRLPDEEWGGARPAGFKLFVLTATVVIVLAAGMNWAAGLLPAPV